MSSFTILRRVASVALVSLLVIPGTAHAASFGDYSDGGPYRVSEYGEWAPPPFGPGGIPVLQFGHRDYIPETANPGEKFPFVLITAGVGGDGRFFGETYAKQLASRGFVVRIGYGAANLTFATPEAHLSAIGLEINQGRPSLLAQKADFSRSALVGYSAGAGASLWAGATQGGIVPQLGLQIPGFKLGAMVNMGLPANYYAAEPLVPDELPVLIMYGESDPFGLGAASHALMHGLAENKNQTIVGVRGANHLGPVTISPVNYQNRYYTLMTAWLTAQLGQDGELQSAFRNRDPELINSEYFTVYDQTMKARSI
ncbi:lipase family protein [uncultured Corynebacterium sp.]|uniref:lipase family protein n=1 Tax=uncultured Corynebacterium sp. TaxID=159447 RepID=UPI0025F40A1D|nr:lipase family protein [uncultured Corynebacterium sp.]